MDDLWKFHERQAKFESAMEEVKYNLDKIKTASAKKEAFDYEARRLWIETAIAYTKSDGGFEVPCHEYANKLVDEFIQRFQTDG